MSKKVYGICENKCLEEVVSKTDIAVLKGDLKDWVLTEEVDEVAIGVPYPEGFNGNNSVVIAQEVNSTTSLTPDGYVTNSTIDYIYCIHGGDDLTVNIKNITAQKNWSDYSYRVVLMKLD